MNQGFAGAGGLDDGEARILEAGEMKLRVEHRLGEVTLAVYGEVDLSSASILDRELRRAIERAPKIVVDLSAVQFIDSTGLRSLMVAVRDAEARSRELAVLRPPADVGALLALTGVDEELHFLD